MVQAIFNIVTENIQYSHGEIHAMLWKGPPLETDLFYCIYFYFCVIIGKHTSYNMIQGRFGLSANWALKKLISDEHLLKI